MFFFASDLHGREERYRKLLNTVAVERPRAVLLGGDLLPSTRQESFIDWILSEFERVRNQLRDDYPRVVLIMGNDDPRVYEADLGGQGESRPWELLHGARTVVDGVTLYGYPYVPPTPFLLKDWERYDIAHYVDPGCISPEEGSRSTPIEPHETKYATIEKDLERLAGNDDVSEALFLFHTPPYRTALDRTATDGQTFDHAPLDPHVGSIAVRRFIEMRQPRVTLHGHVHESARLTGKWLDRIGRTVLLGAAHDGEELALIRFDPREPERATRDLL